MAPRKNLADPSQAPGSSCSTPANPRSRRSIERDRRRRMSTFAARDQELLIALRAQSATESEQAIRHYAHMRCPKCGESLEETWAHGVTMAACPGCDGVWLDKGAWERRGAKRTVGSSFLLGLMASSHAQVLR